MREENQAVRPVVGILCCSRSTGDEMAQAVIKRYVEGVAIYADCAVLLVPARPDLMRAFEIADRLDGLLLSGSPSNLEAWRYDTATSCDGPFDAGRDDMSLALIDAMIARGRPVFGICRGFQEINVAFGGTLAHDLSHADRELPHHAPDGVPLATMFGHAHDVRLSEGGILARTFHTDHLRVNSVHYQGVDRLGGGLSVEATATDGVIEAASTQANGAAIVGVQWHPEWDTGQDNCSVAFFELLGRVARGESLESSGNLSSEEVS